MNKGIFKSSIILILGGLICKLLGACFRIPLTNFLGLEGIGVFQIAMSLYAFALVLCSGGMNIAMSKIISENRALGNFKKNNLVFKKGIVWSVIVGGGIGLIFLLFGKNIAYFQNCSFATMSYYLVGILLPLGCIIACLRGICQGFEDMLPTAVSQIFEQLFRFLFGLLFAGLFVKQGVEFGVFGAFLGLFVAELVALAYLCFSVKKFKVFPRGKGKDEFVKINIFLTLGVSVFPLLAAVDSLIIINRLQVAGFFVEKATALFGLCTGVVGAILNFPLIISSSLSMALLPTISFWQKKDSKQMQKKINESFNVMLIFLLPIVLGVVAISQSLYSILYPSLDYDMLHFAVELTKLGAISAIFCAIMQFFVSALQAQNKIKQVAILQAVAGFIKILLVFVLCSITEINIFGLTISNIIMFGFVLLGCLILLKNTIKFSIQSFLVPVVSSIAMFFVVSFFIAQVDMNAILKVLLACFVGGVLYLALILPFYATLFKKFFKDLFLKKKNN